MKGKFIAFEGSHAAGKTTQIEGLAAIAKSYKLPMHVCKEYKHPRWQEYSRAMFSDNPHHYAQHMYRHKIEILDKIITQNDVEKRVEDGQVVVIDRYIQSLHAIYSFLGISERQIKYNTKGYPQTDMNIQLLIPPYLTKNRSMARSKKPNPFKVNDRYNAHLIDKFTELKKDSKTITIPGVFERESIHKIIRSAIWPTIEFDSAQIPKELFYKHHKKRRL